MGKRGSQWCLLGPRSPCRLLQLYMMEKARTWKRSRSLFPRGWLHPPHQPRNHKASFLPHHSASYSTHPTHFNRTRKRAAAAVGAGWANIKQTRNQTGVKVIQPPCRQSLPSFTRKLQSFSLNGRFLSEKALHITWRQIKWRNKGSNIILTLAPEEFVDKHILGFLWYYIF